MVEALLQDSRLSWLQSGGADRDVVLASRILLSRNLRDLPFPNRADLYELAKVEERVAAAVPALQDVIGENLQAVQMENLSNLQREVLREKQLISEKMLRNPQHRTVYVGESQAVSLMVNEEDHIRIQCVTAGLNLAEPLKKAFAIDDMLESQLDIAFDEKMGYLTSSPTNLGTGLRAAVLLHLPGLVFTRNVSSIINISPQLGLAVRPLYGDDKEQPGCLFQIANQLTLGYSEQELIDNLRGAVTEIVAHERRARKALALYMKERLEDEVWRAYGTLSYARLLSEKEVLELLSRLRLGMDLKLIRGLAPECYGQMLLASRTSFLQNLAANENLSKTEIDRLRAQHVRRIIEEHQVSLEE
ncbi:MAG: ATP--guanido phosphotransferase [Selenomonas ruminantium]|jgi:protein arginine kinase|uniref:ATP--guanido phosphotransferase n=1 Tax=Selenomonas ruminantium TaxID=971 RepID=A0A927WG89_SELRU|nr:protein arginine kinase [Selenomonas ruminantium]MBE6083930.1 ATP--guanido phosphotransferase [Selenomonas ruminantium]